MVKEHEEQEWHNEKMKWSRLLRQFFLIAGLLVCVGVVGSGVSHLLNWIDTQKRLDATTVLIDTFDQRLTKLEQNFRSNAASNPPSEKPSLIAWNPNPCIRQMTCTTNSDEIAPCECDDCSYDTVDTCQRTRSPDGQHLTCTCQFKEKDSN
jgi:hypothetical protein